MHHPLPTSFLRVPVPLLEAAERLSTRAEPILRAPPGPADVEGQVQCHRRRRCDTTLSSPKVQATLQRTTAPSRAIFGKSDVHLHTARALCCNK